MAWRPNDRSDLEAAVRFFIKNVLFPVAGLTILGVQLAANGKIEATTAVAALTLCGLPIAFNRDERKEDGHE